jgi:RNA polymerase sigma-70 factor (ECF subfamily)
VREGRVEDPTRLDAYVLGTCRNTVMGLRRKRIRDERLAERATAGLPDGYEPRWESPDQRRVEHCLQELETRERTIVLATFLEDRDAGEIGAALQLSAGNVRVIRHRALARLQGCVEGGHHA